MPENWNADRKKALKDLDSINNDPNSFSNDNSILLVFLAVIALGFIVFFFGFFQPAKLQGKTPVSTNFVYGSDKVEVNSDNLFFDYQLGIIVLRKPVTDKDAASLIPQHYTAIKVYRFCRENKKLSVRESIRLTCKDLKR